MSKKEMEKSLSYGDCFSFLGALFGSLLASEDVEKKLDEKEKNN